jgi:hypothetical protein
MPQLPPNQPTLRLNERISSVSDECLNLRVAILRRFANQHGVSLGREALKLELSVGLSNRDFIRRIKFRSHPISFIAHALFGRFVLSK